MPKPLIIEDIRNPQRQSGFDYVKFTLPQHNTTKPYNARTRRVPRIGVDAAKTKTESDRWWGPRRATAEEAAQDYCDYVNGNRISAPTSLATVDKTARPNGTKRVLSERERRLRSELRAELRRNPPQRLHEPVCYLVGVKNDRTAVKIGYADYNVYSRLDSLQTGNPRELRLLGTLPGGIETEKRLHAKYIHHNVLQEWFRPSSALLGEFGLTWADYTEKVFRA